MPVDVPVADEQEQFRLNLRSQEVAMTSFNEWQAVYYNPNCRVDISLDFQFEYDTADRENQYPPWQLYDRKIKRHFKSQSFQISQSEK